MQKNVFSLNQVIEALSPYSDDFSDEKIEKLEWFIKLEAVKAVNDENKGEFEKILKNNDINGLISFITKYIPNFHKRIIEFMKEN